MPVWLRADWSCCTQTDAAQHRNPPRKILHTAATTTTTPDRRCIYRRQKPKRGAR
jgi:hypothetical protein